jgi:hypothetical protein
MTEPLESVFYTLEYAIEEAEFLAQREGIPFVLLAKERGYTVKPKKDVIEGETVLETFLPKYN